MTVRVLGAALACVGLSGCVYYLNPQCTDQIRNGDETDIDCGGSCGLCNVGDSCNSSSDCDESNCIDGTCRAFDCDNGIKGQEETDVDCGGPACRKCSGGRHCVVDADCFSGTCDVGTKTCSELATVSFADAAAYSSGFKSYALFSGDLNHDGRIDVVVANEADSTLSVFLQTAAGTFQSFATGGTAYPTGEYPTGGALADFNHDGILDVITADYHGDSVTILFGTGTGALTSKRSFPTEVGAETSNLAVGDLDNDGNLDVIATNPGNGGTISQFMGNADGTLGPSTSTPVGGGGVHAPFSAAIGDFDGNGTNDVAVADVSNGPIIIFPGNGDGTFKPPLTFSTRAQGPFIIIARDVNLDGKLDLLCADRDSDNISVLLGRGDGTFKKAILATTGPATGPFSIEVADFNQDGVPDVVTANFMTSNATVLLGIGNGNFEPPIFAGATGTFSYGVVAGDFNGDGKPDFATANAESNDMTVKLSTSH